MGTRRGQAIFAAALAAHAALFAMLALGLHPPPVTQPPEVAVAPVYLVERRPPREALAQAPRRTATLPVLSRPAETAEAPAIVAAPEPGAPAAAPSDADGQRLARALRAGRVGCANPSLLSEAEQLACQDRLEEGSKLAKHILTPLPPERRAYYDAVVKAKADFRKRAVVGEHGPRLACKITFGGPKGSGGWKHPHGLKLGRLPCYVVPPMGPLTVEADITNPDTVVRDPKKVMTQ